MTVISLLREPRGIGGQIERCLTEMQWLVGLFCRIAKNMDMQSQDAKQILADMTDFCTSNGAIIAYQMKYLEKVNKQVTEMILHLEDPTERDVLFKLYIQGMSFNEIAEEMNESCDSARSIHKCAIEHLQEVLGE